jgi:hypothetical protein
MSRTTITQSPARRFALERFAWGAPDRLELSGTFSGLHGLPGPPVLVLSGADRTHRLPTAESGAPESGETWSAVFVWEEPPAAFESAVLQLGSEFTIELPEPGEHGDAAGDVELPVQFEPAHATERLRLEAELLAQREELHEARAALQRTEAELRRTREELRAERDGRAADAVRFRDGLAQLTTAAEETLTAKDAELADVRGELDVAVAFREEAEAASQAEIAGLRERFDEVRSRLDAIRKELG